MDTAVYNVLNRSNKKTLGLLDAGASRSKAVKNNTNQKMVYTVFTGNSAGVKSRGNRDTWPATAKGRKAPRWRRSRRAMRLKGIMTSNMAFSCTCHPKRNEAYPQRVTAPMNFSQDGSADEKKRFRRGRIWKTNVK